VLDDALRAERASVAATADHAAAVEAQAAADAFAELLEG